MNEMNTATRELLNQFNESLQTGSLQSAQRALDTLWEKYEEDDRNHKNESLATTLAESFSKIGVRYQESTDIFAMLDCVCTCRDLLGDFPSNDTCAYCFLECMTGLLYLKNMMREDGMVEEFSDEIYEIAERFASNENICGKACNCLANMIPLCGGYDAPLSLAYRAVDMITSISAMHPNSEVVQTVLGHALISACAIAAQTQNSSRLAHYKEQLDLFLQEKKGIYNTIEVFLHRSG